MLRSRHIKTVLGLSLLYIAAVLFMQRSLSHPRIGEGFASDRGTPQTNFDSARAMKYLREICDLGPRISGSEAMKKQQDLIEKHFTKLGAKVQRQIFEGKQPSRPKPITMTNLIVSWHSERDKRVLICCHYDTRPLADQEPDRAKWALPFVSANDGASSVAWLMELGNHIKDLNTTVGVDFVIFDGEEYVFDGPARGDHYCLGSEHFAAEYVRTRPRHRYLAGVLLDLFAGQDAKFPYEQNSLFHAGAVIRDIWGIAREQKVDLFVTDIGDPIEDDHLPLNRAGIPTVDIIDFKYPHWHRLSDTPDKCSEATMTKVAKVLTTWLTRVK